MSNIFSHLLAPSSDDFYPYEIPYSCRFNDDDSAYLHFTPSTTTDRRTWTWSGWVKRAGLGTLQAIFGAGSLSSNQTRFSFDANDKIDFSHLDTGVYTDRLISTQVFRDVAAFFHLLVVVDTTDATAADRVKIFINGERITDFATENTPALNKETDINRSLSHQIGKRAGSSYYADNYLADVHFVDGQALDADDFGQFKNGIWIPKQYTGSYGTNGFHLDFADSADLGNDVSGNGNDFTSSGLTTDDQVIDTPTNNFMTLGDQKSLTHAVLSDGNLQANTSYGTGPAFSSIAFPSTGKWYLETELTGGSYWMLGICGDTVNISAAATLYDWYYYLNGNHYYNGGSAAYGSSFTTNDVIGITWDSDAKSLTFYKNNVSQGAIDLSAKYADEDVWLMASDGSSTGGAVYVFDFGQHGFTYTPPTGFLALCSANLPEPVLTDCSEAFDISTWTGTAATKEITDVGFNTTVSGLAWIKARSSALSHRLLDSDRGATLRLLADGAQAEATEATGLTSFNSDGISLGVLSGYNGSGVTHVGWFFNMLVKHGMDIVQYTGTGIAHTEAHGLGAIPEAILVKNRDQADGWRMYHKDSNAAPEDYALYLDTDAAAVNSATFWNDTAPTSSVFTVATGHSVNASGEDYVAYLFRSISGLLKVSAYTGNGNADGPYVCCGFRPRFILIKAITLKNWVIYDTARNTYNPVDNYLIPSLPNSEASGIDIDVTSSGFKIRSTNSIINTSTVVYTFIAIAEQPFKYANAR